MLTEEAHHMFVGESGVSRVIQRTCEAMKEAGISDPNDIAAVRALGVIDLPTIQKKINFHLSVTEDLFGAEVSTNGAAAFEAGIKGRFQETKIDDDHQLYNHNFSVMRLVDGAFKWVEEPALNAVNARLVYDYIKDAQGGVNRWNKLIDKIGIDFEMKMPHMAFHRKVGEFADLHVSPAGELLSAEDWQARSDEFLPSQDDLAYISSLMKPVTEAGQYASWIAAPKVGINSKPGDFEYVRLHD
jgi:benzoyl-CoA 2,3-dioxygenase component B